MAVSKIKPTFEEFNEKVKTSSSVPLKPVFISAALLSTANGMVFIS
jgi:hypothetical protein